MQDSDNKLQQNNYSLFVSISKKILLLLLIILLFALVLLPMISGKNKQLEVNSKSTENIETPALVMSDVKLDSWIKKIGKYEINANKVIQATNGSIKLNQPEVFLNQLKNPITINSNNGEVTDDHQEIKFIEDVVVKIFNLQEKFFLNTYEMIFLNQTAEVKSGHITTVTYGDSHFVSDLGFVSFLNDKKIEFLGPIKGEVNLDQNRKIDFISKTMHGDWFNKIIYLKDDAKIIYQDLVIYADLVESKHNKVTDSFDKIFLKGNIKLITKNQTITCDDGVYDIKSNKIILTNNVVLIDATKKINSNEFIYLVNKGYGYVPKQKNNKVKAKLKIKNKK
jgi:LPS export ABC transporter protein LptC